MDLRKVTRQDLHDVLLGRKGESMDQKKSSVLEFLYKKLNLKGDEIMKSLLAAFIQKEFFHQYFRKWDQCSRTDIRFRQRHSEWLNQEIKLPPAVLEYLPSASASGLSKTTPSGRAKTHFDSASDRSKRRKVEQLRSTTSLEALSAATSMKLRSAGDNAAAKIVKEVTTTTPTRGKRMLSKWKARVAPQRELSEEEAVSLIVTGHFTKNQYLLIRETAKSHGHNIYPNYERVRAAKRVAYPGGVTIAEDKCEVDLQSLLNHTAARILSCVALSGMNCTSKTCTLICKWGFDGSSGHSIYKQMWEKSHLKDDSLLATSLVPLQLLDSASGEPIWSNPRPSSTRFCGPIRIQWIQETKESSLAEERNIKEQIKNLQCINIGNILIKFDLVLTMIDGKVCSALNESSYMKCYICGANISEMNNIKRMRKINVDESKYSFGLSILHCYIRFFECLLHISYRLDIKKWKVKSVDGSKLSMEKRKKAVQYAFRSRMGLVVDLPKTGCGTTNDGNTARRYFANPALSAEISGIAEELITRFAIILRAISSGLKINDEVYLKYCRDTAKLYVKLYPWYYMPPTVHKVLINGADIVKHAILPIGQLSEEALEARHKDIRRYREHHTRKMSRLTTNHDLFHRLLLTSDPLISCSAGVPRKVTRNIPEEVKHLLLLEHRSEGDEEMSYSEDFDSNEEGY